MQESALAEGPAGAQSSVGNAASREPDWLDLFSSSSSSSSSSSGGNGSQAKVSGSSGSTQADKPLTSAANSGSSNARVRATVSGSPGSTAAGKSQTSKTADTSQQVADAQQSAATGPSTPAASPQQAPSSSTAAGSQPTAAGTAPAKGSKQGWPILREGDGGRQVLAALCPVEQLLFCGCPALHKLQGRTQATICQPAKGSKEGWPVLREGDRGRQVPAALGPVWARYHLQRALCEPRSDCTVFLLSRHCVLFGWVLLAGSSRLHGLQNRTQAAIR